MSKTVVTRFAPSPTGFLHIGGARTALFNWLYAKNKNGKFLLRIEDTDTIRSTDIATTAIFEGLKWLGLSWDGEAISQKKNRERHQDVAEQLLKKDLAYRCYSSQDEINDYQIKAKQRGISSVFRSPWRENTKISESNVKSVIRLKSPDLGITQISDKIKGSIKWKNNTLDDIVLLRADRTPTYMLAVVVDDHDMLVSHIIRGDDHLTNTARQILIYNAMNWNVPHFAHLPLINGSDGAKLSKRHGAIGVIEYKNEGYPSIAFKNYLARLGWSHGDVEHFTMEEAVNWFSLEKIGKSPARFDKRKLDSVSKYHLGAMNPKTLTKEMIEFSNTKDKIISISPKADIFERNIDFLKERSKTYLEIYEKAAFFLKARPITLTPDNRDLLTSISLKRLERLTLQLPNVTWSVQGLENFLSSFTEEEKIKFHEIAQPLRLTLTGKKSSPSIATIMCILGKEETLNRISDFL